MPLNRNTLMRIRTIDACLCRRQRRWTLEDLRQACEEALYDYEGVESVSIRTIQRDIELMRSDKLGYLAPIVVVDHKYYTYEDPNYSIAQLPLSSRELAELSSAVEIIKHYQGFRGMTGAEDILARMQDKIHQQETREPIVFIDTNTQLKGLSFLAPLYDFIARKEPVVVHYRSFRARRDSRISLSPYLLKEFNNRWFLFGYNHKNLDIQNLALDRILRVERNAKGRYVENRFMNPERYFDEMIGVTRDLRSQAELVTLRFDAAQAPYILTKPLHHSQQVVTQHADGSVVVQIRVIHNLELEGRILGFGHHVEVLAPRRLRHRIAQSLLSSAAKYGAFFKD